VPSDPDSIAWESKTGATMNADTSDIAGRPEAVWLRLGPGHSAPRTARKLVYNVGRQAGSPAPLIDNAAFVVGELVRTSISQTHSQITVQLTCEASQVTLRVRDGGSGSPLRNNDIDASAARCWDIVRRLSVTWGFSDQQSGCEMSATLREDGRRIRQLAA
jgi:hypothetical protein